MRWTTSTGARLALCGWILAALAASAWAQDYTITRPTGMLEARPSGATKLPISSSVSRDFVIVDLPFDFPYYGRLYTQMQVTPSGFLLPGNVGPIVNQGNNNANHGQDWTTYAFPYTPNGVGGATDVDGIIAAYWDNLRGVNESSGGPSAGAAYRWTTGMAPSRHFVVSWENVLVDPNAGATRFTVQVHLYETTGRIVFAYSNSGGYTQTSYVCGLDSYGDARFVTPVTNSDDNLGYPGSDFAFDPRAVTYTGRLLFDKIVSDATGIGNSTEANRPIGGCRLELRRDGGIVANSGTTADDGTFSFSALAVPSSSSGTFHVLSRNDAASVGTTGGGAPYEWTVNSSLSYASGSDMGTLALGSGADSDAALRAPFNVARACLAAYDWAAARTTDVVPRVDVVVDPSASFTSSYQPAGVQSALLRVGGPSSANSDVWDDAIVVRTYARHLLASIAGSPTTAEDHRFDAVTDTQNAFAEGFGYFLWAAVSGESQAIDGLSASSAAVHDMEDPTITVPRGPDVAGCVAAALYDLLDAANEVVDAVDGTSAPERVLELVDGFTVCPTASTFLQAWVDAGYDAAAITRLFVGAGALTDDAFEPNDDRTEAPQLGAVGLRRSSIVLNRFNEDWFDVTLAAAAPALFADVAYDRSMYSAVVGLEVRDAGGTLLATGAPVGPTGPISAATPAVPAGSYRIGVRHLGGDGIPSYSVQSYVALGMAPTPFRDWTQGRPYDAPLGIVGGVPPYTVTTVGSALPPGLAMVTLTARATGTPSAVGTYPFTIQLRDDGDPSHVVLRNQSVTINPPLELTMPGLVAFAVSKPADGVLAHRGGTAPITLTIGEGALPEGVALVGDSLQLAGAAATPGSTRLRLDAVDVAGSASTVDVKAVVCVAGAGRAIALDLAAGDAACGYFVDAVVGSTLSASVKTAKKQPKRLLVPTVLLVDGTAAPGGKLKSKVGSAGASGVPCPATGRYFVVFASAADDATQLVGGATVAPPKRGKAKLLEFDPRDTLRVEIGALAGARLVFKSSGDAKAGLTARVAGLLDPEGRSVPIAGLVTASKTGFTLSADLPAAGTWTVLLGATATGGEKGKLSYAFSIKQPKGEAYSAD